MSLNQWQISNFNTTVWVSNSETECSNPARYTVRESEQDSKRSPKSSERWLEHIMCVFPTRLRKNQRQSFAAGSFFLRRWLLHEPTWTEQVKPSNKQEAYGMVNFQYNHAGYFQDRACPRVQSDKFASNVLTNQRRNTTCNHATLIFLGSRLYFCATLHGAKQCQKCETTFCACL